MPRWLFRERTRYGPYFQQMWTSRAGSIWPFRRPQEVFTSFFHWHDVRVFALMRGTEFAIFVLPADVTDEMLSKKEARHFWPPTLWAPTLPASILYTSIFFGFGPEVLLAPTLLGHPTKETAEPGLAYGTGSNDPA